MTESRINLMLRGLAVLIVGFVTVSYAKGADDPFDWGQVAAEDVRWAEDGSAFRWGIWLPLGKKIVPGDVFVCVVVAAPVGQQDTSVELPLSMEWNFESRGRQFSVRPKRPARGIILAKKLETPMTRIATVMCLPVSAENRAMYEQSDYALPIVTLSGNRHSLVVHSPIMQLDGSFPTVQLNLRSDIPARGRRWPGASTRISWGESVDSVRLGITRLCPPFAATAPQDLVKLQLFLENESGQPRTVKGAGGGFVYFRPSRESRPDFTSGPATSEFWTWNVPANGRVSLSNGLREPLGQLAVRYPGPLQVAASLSVDNRSLNVCSGSLRIHFDNTIDSQRNDGDQIND